jgi:hypothetical protein
MVVFPIGYNYDVSQSLSGDLVPKRYLMLFLGRDGFVEAVLPGRFILQHFLIVP